MFYSWSNQLAMWPRLVSSLNHIKLLVNCLLDYSNSSTSTNLFQKLFQNPLKIKIQIYIRINLKSAGKGKYKQKSKNGTGKYKQKENTTSNATAPTLYIQASKLPPQTWLKFPENWHRCQIKPHSSLFSYFEFVFKSVIIK